MTVCGHAHRISGVNGVLERPPDPLELELYVVVSCLTWALDTELGSSTRAVGALDQ